MSTPDPAELTPEPASRADFIAQAIAALTAAAQTTRIIGQGTPNEHSEPADFAEIACHVLTSVAANVGSVETLLAGRPGSWEADYVRQIVQSTAGDEPDELLRWRTVPVRLAVDVEGAFDDFGLYELYEADREQAIEHEQDDSLTEEQAAEAGAITDAIDRLLEQDQAAYREAYIAAVRQALTRRGLTADVEAVDQETESITWDPFTEELHEHARATTPLPMTGEAPDWTDGTPADALRRAGLTYIARAQEAVR